MELNCSSLSSLSITNIARVKLTVLVLSLTSAFIIDDNMNVKMDSTLSCNAMKSNMDNNIIVVVSIHGDDHTIYDYDNNVEWHTIEWQYYGMILLRVIQPRW